MATFDAVIKFKYQAIDEILRSQDIMSLMFDTPNIDMDCDAVYNAETHNVYDYSFCDDTFAADKAVLFIESALTNRPSEHFGRVNLIIQVMCNNNYVSLPKTKFKGMLGNRIDNICQSIIRLIDGSTEYGIGRLYLSDCQPCSAPNGFAAKQLVFTSVDSIR